MGVYAAIWKYPLTNETNLFTIATITWHSILVTVRPYSVQGAKKHTCMFLRADICMS
ncbi:Uncharacterised protein [uncultured Blautia sp.]|nr:Uncharacterised protein [uncultured Blautia sp.]